MEGYGAIGRAQVYARARLGSPSRRKLFAEIWRHYYPRLHVFIRRMIENSADVDDAVQEVMLKVYQNLTRYSPDYAVSTWIYSIARNHCVDFIRAARVALLAGVPTADGFFDAQPAPYPSPEDALMSDEGIRQVRNLVGRLEPADEQIAFLFFFEEMPYRAISSIMNTPIGTLKYRVHRIRKILGNEKEEIGW